MSRTFKDRPYWVQLNESKWFDHDHTRLGEETYTYNYIKDDNGEQVYDSIEWALTAQQVVDFSEKHIMLGRWYITSWRIRRFFVGFPMEDQIVSNMLHQQARDLVARGAGETLMHCGVYQQPRRERVLAYVMADHCTDGEALLSKDHLWWRHGENGATVNPCQPAWDGAFEGGFQQTRNMAGAKHFYSRARYSHERNISRDTLKDQAKAWNSGWDVEDWDQSNNLTAQHHHSMNWDLW